MLRFRRAWRQCLQELRPYRQQLERNARNVDARKLVLRFISIGLLFYIALYTGFYFLHHRFGVDRSGVLQQYAKELSLCWHDTSASHAYHPGRIRSNSETRNGSRSASHERWPVELSFKPQSLPGIEGIEGIEGEGAPVSVYQGVRRFPRRVWAAAATATGETGAAVAVGWSMLETVSQSLAHMTH
jgi:hypothetical protein